MARIYLARSGGIGSFERFVVLKMISPERATDPRFVTMFLDEAKLAATLNHQNVCQVYEVDEADGALFITMEYVHGENLRLLLETCVQKGWTIPLELAVAIIGGCCAGLHHAHERKGKNGQPLNIVHRDVTPANIMVGFDGSVKMVDFGIAKADERSTQTQQGTIKGKYGYMSPEQCRGKSVDRRTDIFALGIVLYELCTLRRAFRGEDEFDTMKRIVNGDIVPPSVAVPGFPRELESIILTAMARDPEHRFQTGQEMHEALDAYTNRSKTGGSASGLARFMTQLFGVRREPWVESRATANEGGDATEISMTSDALASSNASEATSVLEGGAMPAASPRGSGSTTDPMPMEPNKPRVPASNAATPAMPIPAGAVSHMMAAHGTKPGVAPATPRPTPTPRPGPHVVSRNSSPHIVNRAGSPPLGGAAQGGTTPVVSMPNLAAQISAPSASPAGPKADDIDDAAATLAMMASRPPSVAAQVEAAAVPAPPTRAPSPSGDAGWVPPKAPVQEVAPRRAPLPAIQPPAPPVMESVRLRSRWPWVIIGLLVVVLITVGAFVVMGIMNKRSDQATPSAPASK